jgi:hypothetical protein
MARALACFALAFLSFIATSSSWVQDTSRPLSLPPLASGNTVFLQLQPVSLQGINAATLSFTAAFYVSVAWRDDRYLTQPQWGAGDFEPSPEFVNAVGSQALQLSYAASASPPTWVPKSEGAAAGGAPSGWVVGSGMKRDEFTALIWLRKFPTDAQNCPLLLESGVYNSSVLTWRVVGPAAFDPLPLLQGSTRDDYRTTTGWDIAGGTAESYVHHWPILGESYSRVRVAFTLQRVPRWYNLRYVATICVVVLISLAANVFEPDDALSALVGCLGVLVAIMYVIAASGPTVPYLTRIDQLLVSSFFLVFSLTLCNGMQYLWKRFDCSMGGKKVMAAKDGNDNEVSNSLSDKPTPPTFTQPPPSKGAWKCCWGFKWRKRVCFDVVVALAHLCAFIGIITYTLTSDCPSCVGGEDAPRLL